MQTWKNRFNPEKSPIFPVHTGIKDIHALCGGTPSEVRVVDGIFHAHSLARLASLRATG
jgi:hypothetical protein